MDELLKKLLETEQKSVLVRIQDLQDSTPERLREIIAAHTGDVPHKLNPWNQEQFWLLLKAAYVLGLGDGINRAREIMREE